MALTLDELRVGDEVAWKRTGVRGTYRCRIVALRPDAPRPVVLDILCHAWYPEHRYHHSAIRYTLVKRVLRVLTRAGQLTDKTGEGFPPSPGL